MACSASFWPIFLMVHYQIRPDHQGNALWSLERCTHCKRGSAAGKHLTCAYAAPSCAYAVWAAHWPNRLLNMLMQVERPYMLYATGCMLHATCHGSTSSMLIYVTQTGQNKLQQSEGARVSVCLGGGVACSTYWASMIGVDTVAVTGLALDLA